jgi:ADP-ribose pyrophosphatase
MVKPWTCIRSRTNQSYRVFSIRTDTTLSPRTGAEHEFYVIESGDWVNVIPLTADQQVVMIQQYRHGSKQITLEIPGGLVDPGDTPESAASRELLEETGYQADAWKKIGAVNPNPAIFSNRCHTFLARNLTKVGNPTLDQAEDIDVVLFPLSEVPRLIRDGVIDHALVIAAFHWLDLEKREGVESF